MAKLIYSEASYANVIGEENEAKLLTEALKADIDKNAYYRSIIITKDGYFVTHGKRFKMVDIDAVSINVGLKIENLVLTITDNDTSLSTSVNLPVWEINEGDGISITNNNGSFTIKLDTPLHDEDNDDEFGVTYSNGVLTFGAGTYDAFGRISSYTEATSLHIDWVNLSIETANKYYLLGSLANTESTGKTVKNTNVFIDFVDNVCRLNVAKLKVDGVGNITLDDNDTTLEAYIKNKVDEAKTQALTYKGTFNAGNAPANMPESISLSGVSNGDVYKVIGGGYVKLKEGKVESVKPGDLLIAEFKGSTFLEWNLVPSGDETETFIQYETNVLSGTLLFTGNGVSYSNNTFTFTNTEYDIFTGPTNTEDGNNDGTSGLVPQPKRGQEAYYLAGSGEWTVLPTINNGKLTLYAGNTSDKTLISESFTANGTDATYNIPYATQVKTTSEDGDIYTTTSGVIKGNILNVPATYGWTDAKVINGIVLYYNSVYKYENAEFKIDSVDRASLTIGTFTANGEETSVKVPYANKGISISEGSVTKYFGVVGTTSTLGAGDVTTTNGYYASPIIDGIVYYQNTWRPVYAYTPSILNSNGDATDIRKSGISTSPLEFSTDFIAVDSNNERGEELYITWAEVDEHGNITYAY